MTSRQINAAAFFARPAPEFQRMARLNKSAAQHLADKPILAPKPQMPCDHGLFSDDKDQLDLADMPMFMD